MSRIAILRRGLIEETGADHPRVAEAIAVSSRVLRQVSGMTTVDVSRTPVRRWLPLSCRFLMQESTKILISLSTLSAYLREDVLLGLFS